MKKIFSILLVSALFISCERPVGPEPDVPNTEDKHACALPASYVNGKEAWVPGDQILIHGEYSDDQVVITLTAADISEDGRTCYLSTQGVTPYDQKAVNSKFYAAYPAALVSNAKHCKDANNFKATNALLMSGYDKGNTFVMESLVGGFVFTVSGDFDAYQIRGNNDETVGFASLGCRITPNAKIYAQNKGTASASIEGAVTADGKTKNHICIPEQPVFLDGFDLVLLKGGKTVKRFYTEEPFEVKRSEFIDLGDITSKLIDFEQSADTHKSSVPTAGAVDLGAAETANCYVVTEPGVYSFKAVKGNSTTPLASIGSAEVLWETWGTTEAVAAKSVIDAVDFEKDQVYFRIAEDFHPGNAVIAVKNDMGVIMWSWHIWVPETPIADDLYGISRRKSMDRNLGALVPASAEGASPKAAGLFYQWGRKDPFPGVADYTTGEPAKVAGQQMSLFGGQMTTSKALKNPTAFADYDGHWNGATKEDLWYSTKTMYDPCPPGYKVPYRSEVITFSNYPWEMPGWGYDPAAYMFTVGNPQAVFPLSGYITTNGEYSQYGVGTRVWSSRPGSDGVSAYNFRIFPNESEGGASYGNGTKPNSNGFSVRCVTIDSVPFENAPGTPVKGAYKKFTVDVQELSGLCLHTDGSFLWGVGDQGVLGKIGFEGEFEKVFGQSLDMESVTIDPATGDLYLGCESNWVGVVKAPEYERAVEIFRVKDAENYGNSGVEGIAWYKDNMLLVGAQTGATLWAYTLDGTVVWKKSLKTVAIGCQEIADICYDPVRDQIWIIDSESQSIYLFNGDATEHLATYKVNYAGNCESVYLDYERNCVWVADDDETSYLFRVDFTF